MKWKEFLKPTWLKIGIVFILFISLFGAFATMFDGGSPSHVSLFLANLVGYLSVPLLGILNVLPRGGWIQILLVLVLGGVYYYLLSCLIAWIIIWIYDKVKKK